MGKTKTSKVWEIFDKPNTSFATCKICKVRYKRSGNTSNLLDYIEQNHRTQWTNLSIEDEVEPIQENNADVASTYTLPFMLSRQQPWKEKLDQLYIIMIAEDMEPLRFGEHLGFKKCMEEEYQRVKDLLQIELNSICYCAITTDMWTSAANEGMLAVTCHYVTNTTDKLKSVLLNRMKIEQNNVGEVISKAIDDILVMGYQT
ncbi:hypothetical protein JTB14_031018 [Gonioctena quinquepunctata]|nr:hypothetical protein JTB14_031018 [Gonioctena quinquepunctata]